MNKIVFILLCLILSMSESNGQKWVSTTAENKNVILEEFTGIHCGYCPDGHARANQIVNGNPGDVFLINVHANTFSIPRTGEPDFRTNVGTELDLAANISSYGYPGGLVNRFTPTSLMGRGYWAGQTATALAEKSPVNLFIKSVADTLKREMTTEVEVYYTSNTFLQYNFLTIALIQDEILGPQSDYGNYNPSNWVNGLYKHNHVLRQYITSGTYGDTIYKANKGGYFYKKYITQIPQEYKGIKAELTKMQVVAFVAENHNYSRIISGTGDTVRIAPDLRTNLSLKEITTQSGYCLVNPKIEVTNNYITPITSFGVSAIINGVTYKKNFTNELAPGNKTIIDWGNITFSSGIASKIEFTGFTNINNGMYTDIDTSDNKAVYYGYGIKSKAFTTCNFEFENGIPTHSFIDNSQNNKIMLSPIDTVKYGNNGTARALMFLLNSSLNVTGKPGHFVFGEVNLTGLKKPVLTYDYAYSNGGIGGSAPVMIVFVSEDCGKIWKEIKHFTAIETGQPRLPGSLYNPKAGEYLNVNVPISDYSGKNILFRITGIPGTNGNVLFIDDVKIDEETIPTAIINLKPAFTNISLIPNPVESMMVLNYELADGNDVQITFYNMLNQKVYSHHINFNTAGNYSETIDLSTLQQGVYTLVLESGNALAKRRVIKN